MATNILKTRIQSKYDTLTNWIASASTNPPFIPLKGEICIVEIPSTNTPQDTTSNNQGRLTPPAIAIKVGDGNSTFLQLPWIQGLAGDVYAWAKSSTKPSYEATEITSTRKDTADLSDQTKWTHPTIEAWLQDLTNDINGLSGGGGSISTQIAAAIANLDVDNVDVENGGTSSLSHHIIGFNPSKTLATLTETDGYIDATFQDIQITKTQVTGLNNDLDLKAPKASPQFTGTPTAPTATAGTNTTQIATTAFVKNAVDTATAGLSGAMHYKGEVSAIPPTGTYESGDVVVLENSNTEYVYDGTAWREIGTEGDYAIKGNIRNIDIASDAAIAQSKIAGLSTDLGNKVDKVAGKQLSTEDYTTAEKTKLNGIAAGAQVNVIEKIQVNGTDTTITNKTVNISVPTGALASKDKVAESDLETTLANKINAAQANVLEGIQTPSSSATDTNYSDLTITNKKIRLAKIAQTGDPNHLVQQSGDYLILDCGSSTLVI